MKNIKVILDNASKQHNGKYKYSVINSPKTTGITITCPIHGKLK